MAQCTQFGHVYPHKAGQPVAPGTACYCGKGQVWPVPGIVDRGPVETAVFQPVETTFQTHLPTKRFTVVVRGPNKTEVEMQFPGTSARSARHAARAAGYKVVKK